MATQTGVINGFASWMLPSFSLKRNATPVLIALTFILVHGVLGGLESKHFIVASVVVLDLYNENTRRFFRSFFPFIMTAVLYDSMRYYYWWGITGHIHVSEPYLFERALFGVHRSGFVYTPNEYLQLHTLPILDFLCGFAYLVFIFEYIGAGIYLFFTNRSNLLKTFAWCFLLVNIMGFATYFIYPAAPPWYISLYGLGPARLDAHATPAGAARFDALLGTHFFDNMYGMSVDVYGAIPSLHVAYPLLVAWAAFKAKRLLIPAVGFYFLMCFSAVYLNHHYIIDIILGTLYAMVALIIVHVFQYVRW